VVLAVAIMSTTFVTLLVLARLSSFLTRWSKR
jgi:hypothetical protein